MDPNTVIIMLATHLICSGGLYYLIGRGMPPRSGLRLWSAYVDSGPSLTAVQLVIPRASSGSATADQVAGAYAQLENARAALQRLVDGAKPAQVDAAEAQMHAAENGLYLAQLQLNARG